MKWKNKTNSHQQRPKKKNKTKTVFFFPTKQMAFPAIDWSQHRILPQEFSQKLAQTKTDRSRFILLCYWDRCGHCIVLHPTFVQVADRWMKDHSKRSGGQRVQFFTMPIIEGGEKTLPEMGDIFQIKGYPTIVLLDIDPSQQGEEQCQISHYTGERSAEKLYALASEWADMKHEPTIDMEPPVESLLLKTTVVFGKCFCNENNKNSICKLNFELQ